MYQKSAMSLQKDEFNRIILIISDTYFEYHGISSTRNQSLKYLSYAYLITRMMLLISILYNSTYTRESQNKYESRTNTTILTGKLGIYFACGLCLVLFSVLANATTNNNTLKHSLLLSQYSIYWAQHFKCSDIIIYTVQLLVQYSFESWLL